MLKLGPKTILSDSGILDNAVNLQFESYFVANIDQSNAKRHDHLFAEFLMLHLRSAPGGGGGGGFHDSVDVCRNDVEGNIGIRRD